MSGQEVDAKNRLCNSGKDERNDKGVETKIEFFGDLSPGRNRLTIRTG
jgi:hypothetical protein